MGEIITFPSNGSEGQGYAATPLAGSGPGVVVIQEWWGLVDHIKDVCDRFAEAGFVALAPDLYRGETVAEPDEAARMMMAMRLDQVGRDMSGAVDAVRDRAAGQRVGVVGFCMGGGLALMLACQRPDAIGAVVPYYGVIPWPEVQPDWTAMSAAVLGHFAANDTFFPPEAVRELEGRLRNLGKEVDIRIYDGVDHAFFNDTRPEVYAPEVAAQTWVATTEFLHRRLD